MKKVITHASIGLGLICFLPSCSVLNGAAGITKSILAVPMGVVRGVTDATPAQDRLLEHVPEATMECIPEQSWDLFEPQWHVNEVAALNLADFRNEAEA